MQKHAVPKSASRIVKTPRFSTVERIILASGACALSLWIGGLAWVGYKIVILFI